MSTTLAPFIKWSDFKSQNKDKPDILNLQIADPQTFETAYSINVRVYHKENQDVSEKILQLKFHESNNDSLIKQWNKCAQKGLVRQNAHCTIKTCLETSKNGRPIRRYVLEF